MRLIQLAFFLLTGVCLLFIFAFQYKFDNFDMRETGQIQHKPEQPQIEEDPQTDSDEGRYYLYFKPSFRLINCNMDTMRQKIVNRLETRAKALAQILQCPKQSLQGELQEIKCMGAMIFLRQYKLGDLATYKQYKSHGKWPNIDKLYLHNFKLTLNAVSRLSGTRLPKLKQLTLTDGNTFGDEGVQHVAKGDWPQIQTLSLKNNRIRGRAMHKISGAKFPHLEKIDLSLNQIDDLGMWRMVEMSDICNLKHLYLVQNGLNSQSMKIFNKGNWFYLKQLGLQMIRMSLQVEQYSPNALNEEGLKHLSKIYAPNLEKLHLFKEGMKIQTLEHLFSINTKNIIYFNPFSVNTEFKVNISELVIMLFNKGTLNSRPIQIC